MTCLKLVSAIAPLFLVQPVFAQYTQQAKWQGATFFDGFDFFTDADPTNGFVKYVDQGTAQANGLITTTDTTAYMGVDYTSVLADDGSQGGRQSVRLTSKATYTEGLFILDASHMPGGICGTWPSWWTVGGDWPNNGEIDIIEGVNDGNTNLASLHTSDNCSIDGTDETGNVVTGNCYQYDPAQSNSGCGISMPDAKTYGTDFNKNGGGVYAMEWTSAYIRVWFFTRDAIPADIVADTPDPSSWGTPAANFQGSCDIPSHFNSHQMVFDTTFCGDRAGAVFASDATCAAKSGSCQSYVASTPGNFQPAYWSINYVAVYQSATQVSDLSLPIPLASQPSTLSSVVPIASTSPAVTASIANNAAGATGVSVPGVTPPADVPAASIGQVPAIFNGTGVSGRRLRRGSALRG